VEVQLITSALQQHPGPKATRFPWLPPLSFSTPDARGPPSLTFTDHPVQVLYKTTEHSPSTAQTPTWAQWCQWAKQPARKIAQPRGSTAAAQLPAVST